MSKTTITMDDWAQAIDEMKTLGTSPRLETPDVGFFDTYALAEIWNVSRAQARRRARQKYLDGQFEQRFYMTHIGGQTRARKVPHYRLKK